MSGIDVPAPSEREAFERIYDGYDFMLDEWGEDYQAESTQIAWEGFQQGVLWRAALSVPPTQPEREAAARICERLAELMENGAGELQPGGRLRQAAQMIRALSVPSRLDTGWGSNGTGRQGGPGGSDPDAPAPSST